MATEEAATPELTRYSSDDLPARDRFAVWREVVGPNFLRLEVSKVPGHLFRARGALLTLPGLGVQWAENAGIRMDRTPGFTADGSDDLVLALVTSGRHFAAQRGREATLDAQSTALLSSGDVGWVSCAAPSSAVVLRVPRAAIEPAVPCLEDLIGKPIQRNGDAWRLLAAYVELQRSDAPFASIELRRLAVSHVYDLLALTLSAGRDSQVLHGRGLRAARLRTIKEYVLANLSHGDLSATKVANRHGVTPRYLHMLFETEGISFSRFVLGARLAAARRMLADPRQDHLRVTEIAYRAGFGDLSNFNRAFRREYGMTPREARRAG